MLDLEWKNVSHAVTSVKYTAKVEVKSKVNMNESGNELEVKDPQHRQTG